MTLLSKLLATGVLALACSGAAAAQGAGTTAAPLPRDSVYQLPLVLTDQDGRAADWRTRRGHPQVVAMFYTSCQYICPLIVDSSKAVDRSLSPAERAKLRILLVSMDPRRDTPAALRIIVAKRNLDTARWTLASPPPDDVRALAGVLGVRYRELADGEFNHTSALLLLDADGRILARTEQVGSKPDPAFIDAVRSAIAH